MGLKFNIRHSLKAIVLTPLTPLTPFNSRRNSSELMGKIKKSCAEEAQDFLYGGIELFLNPFAIGVPTLEHNLEFEH